MIWTLASIPFWISAGILGAASSLAIGSSIWNAKTIEQDDFNSAMAGGLLGLVISGICATVAAKLIS